jgi:zinc/manganese transport system substrate-binding protein
LLAELGARQVKAIVYAAYVDPRPAQWLSERSKLPLAVIAFTVGGNDKAQDLFTLFDDTLARLLAVIP